MLGTGGGYAVWKLDIREAGVVLRVAKMFEFLFAGSPVVTVGLDDAFSFAGERLNCQFRILHHEGAHSLALGSEARGLLGISGGKSGEEVRVEAFRQPEDDLLRGG